MLQNKRNEFVRPERVLVIGASGFVGRNFIQLLKQGAYSHVPVNSLDIDLTHISAIEKVQKLVKDGDAIVFLSAITPDKGKNLETYMKNVNMISYFLNGIIDKNISHFIYMSSDAVYSFHHTVISESTPTESSDYYSLMHQTREFIIKKELPHKYLILRPTMVYGFDDTHHAYGPNRFIRQAIRKNKIELAGNGEETRDYIYIADLCQIILLSLGFTTVGTLNLASGKSISFFNLATLIQEQLQKTEIITLERTRSITHRSFDMSNFHSIFRRFSFTQVQDVLRTNNLHEWL